MVRVQERDERGFAARGVDYDFGVHGHWNYELGLDPHHVRDERGGDFGAVYFRGAFETGVQATGVVGVVVRQEIRAHIRGLVVEPINHEPGELADALDGPELRRHCAPRIHGTCPRSVLDVASFPDVLLHLTTHGVQNPPTTSRPRLTPPTPRFRTHSEPTRVG